MAEISLSTQTMFADLAQRCLDAEFDENYDERGYFVRRRKKKYLYWYYQRRNGTGHYEEYVGPVRDQSISDRVNRFDRIKSNFKERREIVRALSSVSLPTPDTTTGNVVEAMWKAGFFRLRGVLIGSAAYQCYAGVLGVRLPSTTLITQDVDFAQFWGISQEVGESMPPIIDALKKIDPSFREVPDVFDPLVTTKFVNDKGYFVEFLTPNRGSDEHQRAPARMPSLGGVSAQPLRHLDYLIYQPERSVLLFKAGVPVTIPRAERYAVHKLILASERRDQFKSAKDILQADNLIKALAAKRPLELGEAWNEAWDMGPRWREKLLRGRERLTAESKGLLQEAETNAKEAFGAPKRRRRGGET
jgi:hypothetical protein